MGFSLSVNLEYMFHEAGDRLEDRMAAAAKAGFDKVEIFTTGNRDVPSLKAALADTGCQLVGAVADPSYVRFTVRPPGVVVAPALFGAPS